MASYITANLKTTISGAFQSQFESFLKPIVVHKEPIKTIANNFNAPAYGYGAPSNTSEVTLTPVNATFSGNVFYSQGFEQDEVELEDIKKNISKNNKVTLKVKQDAYSYIDDGRKTERIDVDGVSYNVISSVGAGNFANLGQIFYYYKLESTI